VFGDSWDYKEMALLGVALGIALEADFGIELMFGFGFDSGSFGIVRTVEKNCGVKKFFGLVD